MLSSELFHHAKWVTTPCNTPVLRSVFTLNNTPDAAVITICGLGFFSCFINGEPITTELFSTLRSEYHYRFLEFKGYGVLNGEPFSEELRYRIYCPQYDVGKFLKKGENILELQLAPGWYGPCDDANCYGDLKACFYLAVTTAGKLFEIVSDETMGWREHYITESSVYGKETQDFTLPEAEWKPVAICDAPDSNYFLRDCPADTIIRYTHPTLVKEENGVRIYDSGENSSGFPILRSREAGTVTVTFSEELDENLNLHPTHNYGQCLKYICDDTPRELRPYFTWVGYRYFAVEGRAAVERCAIVHTDVAVTSDFTSDNDTLNWIYDTYKRTQLSNMHCGIPSDCPHIERLGYTGDGQLMCDTVMHTLDAKAFYRKWIRDIADCQDAKSGHVQYTAPYTLAGGGPGGWGCAIVTVPYRYYLHYGDEQVLRDNFDGMLHYFSYLEDHSINDIVESDQQGLWCLGEWCTPTNINIKTGYVNTYFYALSLLRVIEIAKIIGRTDVIPMLEERLARKKAAIIRLYFNPANGNFCWNIQMANCFALDLGLGDERTWDNLCASVEQMGCYNTGIFGTEIVTRLLFERGRADLAYRLLTSEGPYSFANWRKQNATTFYEYWGKARSHNHPMFGAVVTDIFRSILGIRQTEGSTRFEKIVISPACIPELTHTKGHITTESGKIEVAYTRSGSTYELEINVPAHTEATLSMGNTVQKLHTGVNICRVTV